MAEPKDEKVETSSDVNQGEDVEYSELELRVLDMAYGVDGKERLFVHDVLKEPLENYSLEEVVETCIDLEEQGLIIGEEVSGQEYERSFIIEGVTEEGVRVFEQINPE